MSQRQKLTTLQNALRSFKRPTAWRPWYRRMEYFLPTFNAEKKYPSPGRKDLANKGGVSVYEATNAHIEHCSI